MARLNVRPSYNSTVPSSRLPSASPSFEGDSEQENYDPRAKKMDKGKQRAGDPPRRANMPTPESGDSSEARGQKRKRTNAQCRGEHGDSGEEDEDEFTRDYDPNQNPDERRSIMRKSRALERDFQERRDDMMKDKGEGLTRTVDQANRIYSKVKQTGDATSDSRLMVNVSDLANKKTAQLVLGDATTGLDVDEFLSKCMTYMRTGGPANDPPTSTARRRGRRSAYDEDDDAIGEPLNFGFLGENACFPYNSRPCVPTFLLGPLSVEKKVRMQTQRRARQSKDTAGKESRPEALSREDLTQSDANTLTARCVDIRKRLAKHVQNSEETLKRAGFETIEDLETEQGKKMMRKCRISGNGGVSLFDFVVNPRSFGQTVENLFYASFLIKEGSCGIASDSEGLPTIHLQKPTSDAEQRKNNTSKHQAVFSLDYKTWESLIEAFDIRDPMIPHREQETATQVGQRGWYA